MSRFKPLAFGFHAHSDQSLDGAATVASKIKRAHELGRLADCITDHGSMAAIASHWTETEKFNKKYNTKLKSIHGIELYVIDPNLEAKTQKNGKVIPKYSHLTVLFKDKEAYQYFCQLTPKMEERAIVKFGEAKPLITLEELEPISGHIVLGSGCLVGFVQKYLTLWELNKTDRIALAERMYLRLRDLAGSESFYCEIMPHAVDKDWQRPQIEKRTRQIIVPGIFTPILDPEHTCSESCGHIQHFKDECGRMTIPVDRQKIANQFVIEMAKKYGDRVVISEDSHFAIPEEKAVQDVRTGNGLDLWKFFNSYHMADSDEWADVLKHNLGTEEKDIEEWIDNSYNCLQLFNNYTFATSQDRWLLPTTEMVYNLQLSSKAILSQLIAKHGRMPNVSDPKYDVYKQRLEYELSVLLDNGVADFLPYFFVLEDAAEYAKKINMLWNTRGSGGGCLIAYLLGISITDPIKYDLPFERFLTLGRILSQSLPDLDTDWEDRSKVLEYLYQKYGDRVSLIATDLMMRLKTSILDVERAKRGYVPAEVSIMCTQIKGAPQGMTDNEWLYGTIDKNTGAHIEGFWDNKDNPVAEELRQYAQNNPETWDTVQRCIGITKTRGVHAGGVVITPESTQKFMPIIKTDKGIATAFNMKGVEFVGGIKYDFLGVQTLKALSITMRSIANYCGIELAWKEFPQDDAVYQNVINAGKLAGIFQLSTTTMAPYVTQIVPKCIDDISNILALVRPGSLDAPSPNPRDPPNKNAAQYFVECRKNIREPYYIHPDLAPILQKTYGVVVFQEQVLRIFRDIAGYTYAEAEAVRRGVGKKIKSVLEEHLGNLRMRCLTRGWSAEQAQRLCDTIIASSRYGFNCAHSISYAIVAYNGAFLKHFYPLHFWKGELTVNADDHDKLREYLRECRTFILLPAIDKSHPTEWLIEGDKLRAPLSVLKGCGEKTVSALKKFIDSDLSACQDGDVAEDTE